MTSLEIYLQSLRDIRRTGGGVKETSYYPARDANYLEIKAAAYTWPKNAG